MSEIFTPQNGEDSNDDRPRLVLDTNTVLALWMFRDPKLEALRGWIEAGKYLLLSSEDTLEELRRVLEYRQFGLSTLNQAEIRANYQARALCSRRGMPRSLSPPAETRMTRSFWSSQLRSTRLTSLHGTRLC